MSSVKLTADALSTAVAGTIEYDGRAFYGTPNGVLRGVIPGMQFFRLNADLAGANVITAQSIFGAGVTLQVSTVYAYEMVYSLTKAAGVTSHTISVGFGGTATFNNIQRMVQFGGNATAATTGASAALLTHGYLTAVTATNLSGAIAAAAANVWSIERGTLSVSGAGTFIPQYTLSAAPGGAYSTVAGSYMLIYPVGVAGANTVVGSWA